MFGCSPAHVRPGVRSRPASPPSVVHLRVQRTIRPPGAQTTWSPLHLMDEEADLLGGQWPRSLHAERPGTRVGVYVPSWLRDRESGVCFVVFCL